MILSWGQLNINCFHCRKKHWIKHLIHFDHIIFYSVELTNLDMTSGLLKLYLWQYFWQTRRIWSCDLHLETLRSDWATNAAVASAAPCSPCAHAGCAWWEVLRRDRPRGLITPPADARSPRAYCKTEEVYCCGHPFTHSRSLSQSSTQNVTLSPWTCHTASWLGG